MKYFSTVILLFLFISNIQAQYFVWPQVYNNSNVGLDTDVNLRLLFNTNGECVSGSSIYVPYGFNVSDGDNNPPSNDYNFFPSYSSGTIAPVIKAPNRQYYILPYKVREQYGVSTENIGIQVIEHNQLRPYSDQLLVNTYGIDNPGEIVCSDRIGLTAYIDRIQHEFPFDFYRYNPDYGKLDVTLSRTFRTQACGHCQYEEEVFNTEVKVGIIKDPNTVFGEVKILNSSSSNTSGVNVSVLANANGEATLDLFWQGLASYCNEVFHPSSGGQITVRSLYADGAILTPLNNASTVVYPGDANRYKAYPVTVRGFGRYQFDVVIKDHWNHQYNSYPITVEVLPSCYGSVAPNVQISGPDIVTINGGYGNALGSYRLQKDQEYTINFGSIQDFCSHYQVSLGDGINVTPPSQNGACFPAISTVNPGTGLQITEYLPNNQGFKFIPLDNISGYKIDIQKRPALSASESNPNLGNVCPSFQPIVFTVGGQNENMTSNCLIVIAPSTISTIFPGVVSYTSIYSVLQYFDYTVSSAKGVIVKSEGGQGIFLKSGARLQVIDPFGTSEIPVAEQVDNNKNWVQSKAYDDEGKIISENKQFFDNRGRPTQNQAKNLSGGVVMATQKIYDKYGRTAITTLPAPIRASEQTQAVEECGDNIQQGQDLYFIYKNDFITNNSHPYSYVNFDDIGSISKMNNPDGVDNTQPGTLGWYYGPNNIANATVDQTKNQQRFIEPYVAQTSYPYSRNIYMEDGTNEVFSATLPGDQHKAGSGKQELTITTELDASDKLLLTDYLTIRRLHVFPGLTNNPIDLDNKAFRVSTKDIEQDEVVSIQDEEGHILINHHIASGEKSFMFYDVYGRKVCAITPNGVDKLLLDKTNNNLYQSIDKKTCRYNYKGQLVETNEKDFGTTRFMYRIDGTLRYSQNEKQRLLNSYTYILYDYGKRPIESGVFTPSASSLLLFNSTELKLTLEENSTNEALNIGGIKSEVIYTVYDIADQVAINAGDINDQTFLKGKVSYNYRYESETGALIKTWFSYDEQGRTLWTAHRIPGLNEGAETYDIKKIVYTYSSNGGIKQIAYTGTMANDNFYHIYYYDLDNRLSHVYTTTSAPVYTSSGELVNGKLQARYSYYLHGSLKRVELAENLQGLDYVYTPQGWLKSFNYPNTLQDPGKDGNNSSIFPEDVFALRMDYFDNDYLKTGTNIISEKYYKAPQVPFKQYYNGNIMGVTWMTKNQIGIKNPAAYGYEYDENYQLNNGSYLSAQFGQGGLLTPNFTTAKFQERNITYDANGNIQTLDRTKVDATALHSFQYQYKANTNQLEQVNDLINNGIYASYTYDAIGQLESVIHEGNTTYVHFDNRGMLTAMTSNSDGTNPIVKFFYDEKGMRYKKESYNPSNILPVVTYYVHDAAKHTVAIYDNNNANSTLAITEIPIYGSDRIGMLSDPGNSQQYQYELKDHLGNVRSVIYPVYTTPDPLSFTSSFEGNDYAGYGNNYNLLAKEIPSSVVIPSGYGSKALALQFPDKSKGIAYRQPLRTGDRLSGASIKVYVPTSGTRAGRLVSGFFNSNGEQLYYDADRLFPVKDSSIQAGSPSQWATLSVNTLTVPSNLYDVRGNIVKSGDIFLHIYVNQMAESGNEEIYYDQLQVDITYVQLVDKSNLQGLIAYTNYYPYGLPMSDKYVAGQTYRYGYQGQYAEADPETEFNSFELRMYDPIIGRWLSVDPQREHYSPYMSMGNNPVSITDPDGGCEKCPKKGIYETTINGETKYTYHKGGSNLPYYDQLDWKFVAAEAMTHSADGTSKVNVHVNKSNQFNFDDYTASISPKAEIVKTVDKHFNGSTGSAGLALDGYRKIPKESLRKFSYNVSKVIKTKPGITFQNIQGIVKSSTKFTSKLGTAGAVLSGGLMGYEFLTDTWDAHTIINGTLLVGTVAATFAGAPVVLGGIAVYGVADYFFDFGGMADRNFGRHSGLW